MTHEDGKFVLELGEFGAREEYEASSRGYWSTAKVRGPDGRCYPVFFYDPVRLAQDLEAESAAGRPYLSERGLIILNEVTRESMEAAIQALASEGYFETTI